MTHYEYMWSVEGSTHTDGSTTAAWPKNSSYVAYVKYISLVLYRVAVSNSHERQNAVGISVCRRLTPVSSAKKTLSSTGPAVCVNSQRTKTQRSRCKNATLQLHVLNCSWTATSMLLLQTPSSTEIEVCRYLDALVDCRLSSTWACSQLQLAVDFGGTKRQCERRINCKINVHMPSVWVDLNSLFE